MKDHSPRMSAASLVAAMLLSLLPLSVGQAFVTNFGGVFILHVPTEEAWEPGGPDPCVQVTLADWKQAKARIPGDGMPHLVVLFAAFPADSVGEVAGTCFGIRFNENVKLWSFGGCSNAGFDLPNDGWPASGGGISVVSQPFKLARNGKPVPLYWFAVSSKGPGYFEVTPNPGYNLGGKFGNTDAQSFLAPIAGYGKVGFDLEGFVPAPGHRPAEGACCLDGCYVLAQNECEFYKGLFLGPDTTCDNEPCGSEPMKGACCLGETCEMLTMIQCVRESGTMLGEGISCTPQLCLGRGAAADSTGPAEKALPDSGRTTRPSSEGPKK